MTTDEQGVPKPSAEAEEEREAALNPRPSPLMALVSSIEFGDVAAGVGLVLVGAGLIGLFGLFGLFVAAVVIGALLLAAAVVGVL